MTTYTTLPLKETVATDADPKAFSIAIGYDESGAAAEVIRNCKGVDEVWDMDEGSTWGRDGWEVEGGRWVQV